LPTRLISSLTPSHKSTLWDTNPGSQSIQGQRKSGLFILPMWVYILQSESTGRYYCGQTSDVQRRLEQHNDPAYQLSKTTKRFQGPWKLLWARQCPDRGSAMKLEMSIKKRGIGRYLSEVNQQ